MSVILYLLLISISIYKYFKAQYLSFLICIGLIIFKGYGLFSLVLGEIDKSTYDYLLIIMLLILSVKAIKNKNILSTKGDKIAKAIYTILLYQLCIVIYTGITGVDSWVNALGQYRFCLLLLLYFIVKNIEYNIVETFFIWLLKIIPFIAILFMLMNIYQNEDGNPFKQTVMGIFPSILFYMLTEKTPKIARNKRGFYICLLSLCIFNLYARMLLIAILGTICFYIVFVLKKKQYVFPIIVLMFISPFMLQYLDSQKADSHNSNDLKTEIEIIQSVSDYSDFRASSGVLRFMSVMERLDYMSQNIFNGLFGIGAMKEETAQNKLSFISGTHGYIKDNSVTLQLDTDDVGFLSQYMRYGLVYIFLFINLARLSFKYFKKNMEMPLMKTGFMTLLMMFLVIPGSNYFFYEWTMFSFLIVLGYLGNKMRTNTIRI